MSAHLLKQWALRLALSVLGTLYFATIAAAEISVVVAKTNPINTLTKKEIVAIYTGKTKAFPNSKFAQPIDQEDDSPIKEIFYREMTNRSVSQINSYWARLVFTGRYVPPLVIKSEADIMSYVAQNNSAIAYVEKPDIELVKVVYVIE
jgi:ABC-type phosphate transport system substrate-binding protein